MHMAEAVFEGPHLANFRTGSAILKADSLVAKVRFQLHWVLVTRRRDNNVHFEAPQKGGLQWLAVPRICALQVVCTQ